MMPKQQKMNERLQEQWDRAVAQAEQELCRVPELDAESLNHAAGLDVQSGVKAGGWTHQCSHRTCQYNNAACNTG